MTESSEGLVEDAQAYEDIGEIPEPSDIKPVAKSAGGALPATLNERDRSWEKEAGVRVGETERVELEGRKKYFELRVTWSNFVLAWITVLIISNTVLTIAIGEGILDFREYQWFITAFTLETFLQIVGMGYIAVRFLFSNDK